jgi:hypothetical protein
VLLEPCNVGNVTVSPETVTRSLTGLSLPVAPRVTVETSGTCTGFRISYDTLGPTPLTIPLVSTAGGGVWVADVLVTGGSAVQSGQHRIEVRDTLGTKRGDAVLVVCDQGATACS